VKAEQRDREKEKNKLNNVAILSVEGGKRNSCYFVHIKQPIVQTYLERSFKYTQRLC